MSGAREQMARLLALVPYLQAHGEISVEDTARTFGVSAGTIQRDLGVLLFCGLPGLGMGDLIDVDFDALEGEGVIRLGNADYLTRPLRLDSTEAAALVVALRTLLDSSAGAEHEVVQRALAKIEVAAGEGAAAAAHVDVRLPETPSTQRLHAELERAVRDRRQVRLVYWSPTRDAVTERVVDPVAVTDSHGHGYLDAWCHLVEGQRLFRIDRISVAEVLDTRVRRRPGLAPRDLSEGLFQASPDDLLVTVELQPGARWVAEYYPVESAQDRRDGVLSVRLRVADPAWLVRLMLRLGGSARVLEPTELAERVRRAALAALASYA